jgi:hypothetical protein
MPARRYTVAAPMPPLLHFCDGHAVFVARQVARPGSLALASLDDPRAALTAPPAPAPRAALAESRPSRRALSS